MSISTVRARLSEHFTSIEGIETAFDTIPRVLQHAELPAVVVFPMRADYDLETYGERIVQEIRLYEAVLFVKEVTEDTEGEAEAACEDFIPLVRAYFLARTGLETLIPASGIVGDMELMGDGSPVAREFPRGSQRMYAAVPFYFRVKELSQISYVGEPPQENTDMTVKDIVAGVGTRYGVVFDLDDDTGLPLPAATAATPYTGIELTGIKGTRANDPTPNRITHKGNDRPYAQDSLPADSLETFGFTTSKTNLTLDSYLEGVLVRRLTNFDVRAANNAAKGNEPRMMAMFYRQALDVDPDSGSFGSLRQYNMRIYGSAQIAPTTDEYGAKETDKSYEGTPSNTQYTPWNEDINATNWGTSDGAHLEAVTAAHPRWNFYRGNGTLVAFQLSHPPVSSSHLLVWSDGTLVTPSSVVTTAANPAFTLSSAPGLSKLVAALIQTNTNV